MLEVNDLRYLKRSQSRSVKIGAWVLAVVACVFTVGAILNIRLASRLAAMQATGFQELLYQWFQGVQIDAQYSGLFLFALNRLQMGIFGLVYGIIMAILFCAYTKSIRRNRRILRFIEEHSQRSS
jgi:Na+/proline symporter